ncbi:hypothetical protein EVAR_39658_1 [Eumeta japonica]|uniref:Nuclear pore complex protein Nup98-Nup96 n=1 Tax=Eumeta variegata TaxID=151549 RepID=A0A4C1WI92_EUMVA|nr:hypothetical protein EVAR_39658_1 [Eumeta japonica]
MFSFNIPLQRSASPLQRAPACSAAASAAAVLAKAWKRDRCVTSRTLRTPLYRSFRALARTLGSGERDNESCFFVRAASVQRFIRPYHVKNDSPPNDTFSFGGTTQSTNTSNLFGASKPAFGATSTAGGGLFGSTTTQAAPAFGTATSTFNFGANAQNQSTNLFAKPATSGFGSTSSTAGGFGSFGPTGGATLFKPASTAAPAPAFGTLSSGFGTNTSTSGGLFSNTNAFGTKPAPAFGFGTNQQTPGLGGGLGTGLGANTFQTKPGGSVFPSFSAGGATGGGSIFTGATQNQAPSLSFGNTLGGGLNPGLGGFGTGTALGSTGLGGFNNTSNMQR